jgi:hypothetical protein
MGRIGWVVRRRMICVAFCFKDSIVSRVKTEV